LAFPDCVVLRSSSEMRAIFIAMPTGKLRRVNQAGFILAHLMAPIGTKSYDARFFVRSVGAADVGSSGHGCFG
jgi:hypothetical protein